MERKEKTIDRFIKAQKLHHKISRRELTSGKKKSHWMWYEFPQISGLGYSSVSKFYAIQTKTELRQYIQNKYLSDNLMELFIILLHIEIDDAIEIFGDIDACKFQSCLTLFHHSRRFRYVTEQLLDKYFNGRCDDRTEKKYKEMK